MASIYTEDSRLVRYEKLRKRKSVLETVLGIAMLLALLLAAGEVVPSLLESILGSLTLLREFSTFFLSLAAVACMAGVIFAIYKKDWRITLIVYAVTCILIGCGAIRYWGSFQPAPLTVALICDLFWAPLTKEEGFPQFRLEVDRHTATEKAWDFTAKKRALETGARTEATGETDMRDLLVEGPDSLGADLTGYQERSMNADPLTKAAEAHSEVMDTLEEL